ncbi:MAG: patatin-like phospholipase family protein, partial [Singulisphaera sp.]|nr:patatin-like phospholipase family protein [Singulisphaera sp.]
MSPARGGDAPDEDAALTAARLEALQTHLTGLAFSGGGIRSGTFAVGFLQGLASLGLLQRIDYLSTVSGGGYAAGWLAAWLAREADVANVERQLAPNRV